MAAEGCGMVNVKRLDGPGAAREEEIELETMEGKPMTEMRRRTSC